MTVTTENKNLVCAVTICGYADIIISHGTDSTQSRCAVSGLKTVLEYVMPYLRDEKEATTMMATAVKGLKRLEENIEFSYCKAIAESVGNVTGQTTKEAFVTVFPALCEAMISKLTETDVNFDRFCALESVLCAGEGISTIPRQLSFINDLLGITVPKFIGDRECKALTLSLTQITDLNYDSLEEMVYGIFRKVRTSKLAEIMPQFQNESGFTDDPDYTARLERQAFVSGLQKYTLETLVLTKEFLESQNLRFYLTEGTLLGAVRHHGFIPWDDDVDIAMPREDYDKLVQLAKEGKIPPTLNFDSLESNPNHWVLGAKMQLTRQTPYIQHKVTKLSKYNGPYVDIFPLDYWNRPAGFKNSLANIAVKICRRLLFMKTGYSKATKKKPARILARLVLPVISNGLIEKIAIKNMKKFYGGNRKYMVNLCSYYPYYKEVFPASFFGEPKIIDFEGEQMPVPAEYDYMLKTVYGRKYDTIPPVRVTNMRKHAFDLREDIKD